MTYQHNQPYMRKIKLLKSVLWGLLAVVCALEIVILAYLCTNHTPAVTGLLNVPYDATPATMQVMQSDNTNITEPFDIQAAGGYVLLQGAL